MKKLRLSRSFAAASLALFSAASSPVWADNWYTWRGPSQDGRSSEKYDKDVFSGKPVWTYDIASRGGCVVADGRVFLFGYHGTGAELVETLTCIDEKTGKKLWEKTFADFLSDNAYTRYAIGAPTIDPETGLVYLLTTPGEFVCYDRDGNQKFRISMMEAYGRLSFPNGRTGAPVIVGDIVIVRGITANWGGDGPARDRFYGFQKQTGALIWTSTPGLSPMDSSFSTGVVEVRGGQPAFYATTGCGHYVALNPLNGKPLWRWAGAKGGINSSPIIVNDKLICVHDKENHDNTELGRLAAVKLPAKALPPGPPEDPVPFLAAADEAWRQPIAAETSSPVHADGMIFQISTGGTFYCMDDATGAELWEMKLGPGNLHSSPTWANGLLYVPILNDTASEDGLLYVIKPTKEKGEILHRVKLEGFAFGAPSISNGRLFVTTTRHLYCFTIGEGVSGGGGWFTLPKTQPGPVVALQALPQEVILYPGKSQSFTVRGIDANGFQTGPAESVKWESFIPPTARVRASLDAAFGDNGELAAAAAAKPSAGAFRATSGQAAGIIRGRVMPDIPFSEDFEKIEIDQVLLADGLTAKPLKALPPAPAGAVQPPAPATAEEVAGGAKFAYPPLPWIGGRFKWDIRDIDGNKMLVKTLAPVFFQRATTFIGSPDMKHYIVQADVMTDGNRRMKSEVGLINQRYLITLKGNSNEVEVSSNQERLKVAVPFPVSAKQWYTLKTRVDLNADGSGVIRGKAWSKGEPEPDKWTIEVPHKNAHQQGSPGLFGFALQGKQRVYMDNISVTPAGK
jgi:outer membrane protein assembly factor BamB